MSRIVLDPSLFAVVASRMAAPRGGVVQALHGVPVFVSKMLPERCGYIEHADGRIEKIGKWPASPAKGTEPTE